MPLARVEHPVPVRVINHIVEIGDALLLHEVAQDIHVAVRLGIRGEDVMVRHDDHLVAVPDLRVLAELAVEHADRARSAHIMRHQDIGLHPNIIAGLQPGPCRPRGPVFSQSKSYGTGKLPDASRQFNKQSVPGAATAGPGIHPLAMRFGPRVFGGNTPVVGPEQGASFNVKAPYVQGVHKGCTPECYASGAVASRQAFRGSKLCLLLT